MTKPLSRLDMAILRVRANAIYTAHRHIEKAKQEDYEAVRRFRLATRHIEKKYGLPKERWSYDASGHIYTYASKSKKVRK